MARIPFVGAAYQARSSNLDAQVCVNLYPVMGESGTAKSPMALYGTPGTRPLATIPDGPIRGMLVPSNGGDAIVVAGNYVYRMDTSFAFRKVGQVNLSPSTVRIADNGTQAVIVTGNAGFELDLTTDTVTRIDDEAFYGASSVDFLATYLIFNQPGSNRFYISGSNEVTFDALDFASAESNAEPIVRVFVNHGELLMFKRTITEVWAISGSPDFPFARNTNVTVMQGCAAPDSVADMDNSVFWLGQDAKGGGIVWRLNGYTPQRVSTDAIEFAIAQYGDISDATAYTYVQEGHAFYVLSFPTGNATWVYDAATKLWHQRAYLDPKTGKLGRHRSNCHMYFGDTHVVGDYKTGELYALDLDYYRDRTDDPMPAIRAAAHVSDTNYGWTVHNRLQVDMESGVGTISGDGSAPVVLLDWSDDGGKTWSNQHAASMGSIGRYRTRVVWRRLGRALDRVYRITITDPVKRAILGAAINPKV